MHEKAAQLKKQEWISIILNSPITIRPHTFYEWEITTVEETGSDQYHSEFPNDNPITYRLLIREQHSGRDRQGSALFWILQWQPDNLPTMNESNIVEGTSRDQHYSEFPNDNQTTRWMADDLAGTLFTLEFVLEWLTSASIEAKVYPNCYVILQGTQL